MRCIALYSGGLDSILSIKIIESQGIEVIPVCFESYFFTSKKAIEIGRYNSINPIIMDISDKHLSIVKKPVVGYGRFLNPCIDCHALMIKEGFEVMKKYNALFIITGEVLNERPFSQTTEGLSKVDRLTGLGDITLRPLSAKLLKETKPERENWVNRNNLFDIHGRTRKLQIELANKFNIKIFEQPAGGCRLTDENFCKRIRPFINEIKGEDIKLFYIGRHFLYNGSHIIIGRNKQENESLESSGYLNFYLSEIPGPTGIFRILKDDSHRDFASELILRYAGVKNGIVIFSDGKIINKIIKNNKDYEKYLIK